MKSKTAGNVPLSNKVHDLRNLVKIGKYPCNYYTEKDVHSAVQKILEKKIKAEVNGNLHEIVFVKDIKSEMGGELSNDM